MSEKAEDNRGLPMSDPSLSSPPEADVRRAVLTVVTLALGPAIGLGIARFAYALVLPDMRADLGWSWAEAGWLNSSNAAGYLLGALFAARAIARAGAFRVMMAGIGACVVALLLCAVSRQMVLLNAARLLAGLGGGYAFVAGGVLATGVARHHHEHSAFLLGLFYAGPGLGILLSGLTVPPLLAWHGPGSWRMAWVMLTLLAVPLAAGLWRTRGEAAALLAATPAPVRYREMGWLLPGYTVFGAGYIAYMTFMIAHVRDGGGGAGFQALFWAVIGLAAMASPWLSATVLTRLRHGWAFAVLTIITTCGAMLPLLTGAVPMLLLSAALFGGAFFAVVASTSVFVRRNFPPEQWAAGIGRLTTAFGAGQVLGPVVAGMASDRAHSLAGGLWLSVLLLFLAALLGAGQRDRSTVRVAAPE